MARWRRPRRSGAGWEVTGDVRHHLIDPQTGLPSTTGINPATVVAGEAWAAEVLVKAVLLASPGGTGLANPDGQGANKLATGGGSPGTPRWAPDNTKIAYDKIAYELYQTGERCSIWVMNRDGGEQTPD
jgi:hypothetical protein